MEVVGFVVGGDSVFLAINFKFPFCDTVCVASGDAAKVGAFLDVFCDCVEAEDDVA